MKFSPTRNLTTDCGRPLIIIEVGVWLFFGPEPEKVYRVDEIKGSRPFSNGIDLFQLFLDTKVHPIVLA